MKIRVKVTFFDNNGVHKVGEICEVENFDANRMEEVKEEKVEKPKKTSK